MSTTRMDDPFHLIAMAVDHDENQKTAIEILKVPLETGKLYHNEKLFFKALSHLRKESRSFRLGWSIPFLPSQPYWNKGPSGKGHSDTTGSTSREKEQKFEEQVAATVGHQNSSRTVALTPMILSGLLASLDNANFSAQKGSTSETTATYPNSTLLTNKNTATSSELVNYTVRMRRAAVTRVRLRIKRERTQRVVKPVLAIVACLGLYSYAWSSLQRLLVGFYGVTNIIVMPPETGNSYPVELRVEMLRLISSPCRSRANTDHYGHLSKYTKACRITEATTFELLTSPHNSRHTKLFARTAYDEIEVGVLHGNQESRTKFSADLMQYDDDYGDDTELPFYAMHTTLRDKESSNIPLDDVIHGRQTAKDKLQRQRWKRRRRQQKYKQHQQKQKDGSSTGDSSNTASVYAKLSSAIQFWGDTTVNHLVRETIVEAHYRAPSSSSPAKFVKSNQFKLKLLDVGSGLSGTLFSLCTPEFPFEDWSYHGIAISQPEVRRANQLVDTVVRPMISSAFETESLPITGSNEDPSAGVQDSDPSDSKMFPLSNITIQRASFDDPLPLKEYTTMVAIESLAFSHNVTNTLMNLAKSLKPKGTLIVIEDVVAPWAVSRGNEENSDSESDYIQRMSILSGKPSLLTHKEWLESFDAADLALYRVRDLMLEFDTLSMDTAGTATATAVTGLPFVGILIGERHWYAIGHGLLKRLFDWFSRRHRDKNTQDDDGNLSDRALYLMEDMIVNNKGNAYRRAAHHRADLGYYMYICTKR